MNTKPTHCIGIDLGTSFSLISTYRDNEAVVIPNALGSCLTPSVVGIDDDGSILVGAAAQERLITHPDLTTSQFKRLMGTNKEIALGKKLFRPEELKEKRRKRRLSLQGGGLNG
jgi:molecular chaperone HscC